MANTRRFKTARDAVQRMFVDHHVPPKKTLGMLEELREELDVMIDACRGDIKRQENDND